MMQNKKTTLTLILLASMIFVPSGCVSNNKELEFHKNYILPSEKDILQDYNPNVLIADNIKNKWGKYSSYG
jgi:hypothetical protein